MPELRQPPSDTSQGLVQVFIHRVRKDPGSTVKGQEGSESANTPHGHLRLQLAQDRYGYAHFQLRVGCVDRV